MSSRGSHAPRQNQWFVPGDGIAREVITADIQRYLGPDALVRPGHGSAEQEGAPGYWITAYRTLTTQMIQDLKLDSQRWAAESQRVPYSQSRTHESRQYYGPSQSAATPVEYPQSRESRQHAGAAYQNYEPSQSAYTHQAAPQYGARPPTQEYNSVPYNEPPPRFQGQPYNAAGQQGREPAPAAYQQTAPQYYYSQQQAPETARQPPSHYQPSAPSAPAPGYYIASDGRQYPLQSQPQQPPQASASDRRRRPGQ